MLEQLLKVIEDDCGKFSFKFENKQYKLTLDDGKTFIGKTIEIVLNDAVDWLDNQEYLNSDVSLTQELIQAEIPEGFQDYAGSNNGNN